MTLSYIDADPRLTAALGSHWARAEALEAAEAAHHRSVVTAAQRARAARLIGLEVVPDQPPALQVLAGVGLGAAHRRALQRLDAGVEVLSEHELRGLAQLMDGLLVLAWDRERVAVSRRWLAAWCAAHAVPSDAATATDWCGGDVRGAAVAHVALGAASAELASSACAELKWAPDDAAAWPRAVVRAAALWCAEAEAPREGLERAAGRLRGGVAAAAAAQVEPATARWLAHGSHEGEGGWQPLLWVHDDEAVLDLALRQVNPRWLPAARTLLAHALGAPTEASGAGAASGPLAGSVDWALESLDVVPGAVLRRLRSLTPVDSVGLLAALRSGVAPLEAGVATLVDGPAEAGTPAWPVMLGLAGSPRVLEVIGELVGSGDDWVSFDAPGEGGLPRLWAHVLVLSGAWDAEWRGRLLGLGAEGLPPVDVWVGELAAEWPSPEDALAGAGTVSSFAHGLHDGVQEAYGGGPRGRSGGVERNDD